MTGTEPIDVDALMDEGVREYNIDALSAKDGDPTPDELREVLGADAEGLDDDAVVAAYKKAGEEAKPPAEVAEVDAKVGSDGKPVRDEKGRFVAKDKPAAEEAPKWDRPYEAVDADGKPLTPEQVAQLSALVAKARFRMKVDKEDRLVDTDSLVRNYQRAITLEKRIAATLEERNGERTKRSEAEAQLEQASKDRKFYERILADQSGATFKAAQQAYIQAVLSGNEPIPPQATAPVQADPATMAAADQLYRGTVQPHILQLAAGHAKGANAPTAAEAQQVAQALDHTFRLLVGREGPFLTEGRLAEILQVDLPHVLAESGFRAVAGGAAKPAASGAPDAEKEAMKKELEALKAERQKEKVRNAPGAGGGGGKPGAHSANEPEAVKKASTFRDIKRLLSDPNYHGE